MQSNFKFIDTPIGMIETNVKSLPEIPILNQEWDENEHCLEMQYPFIKFMLNQNECKKTQIHSFLVGSHGKCTHVQMKVLNELLRQDKGESILLIVSSDFCHYGSKFGYSFDQHVTSKNIWEHIEDLDLKAFEAISNDIDPYDKFRNYLNLTNNTICGKGPILLALSLLPKGQGNWSLLHYEQSSKVKNDFTSSVSYISAIFLS